jgi:L-asparaginase II
MHARAEGVGSVAWLGVGLGVDVKVGDGTAIAETGVLTGSEGVAQAPKSTSRVITVARGIILFMACQVSL